MTDRYTEFLAGERHEDVAIYLTEDVVSNVESLADRDDAVAHDDAVVLVLDGERGRSVFQKTTGMAAMEFAQEAMGADGHVDRDLAGGECPEADGDEDHDVAFVFAFTEAQNEEVGGLYAEGAVVHAYAHCECGASYSERWLCAE
ncbi:hypothetical protein MBEHAL_0739 [Halarchaeum acidiphilum MH1-52-1]|uniref:Uncharacterized protein n=1 Tax=Halarchaeum acidiphilum MH1-52-1 TaxID=1261545 RepID=U3A2V4_9EURY|nr:DUF5807 family protein [Halarchaeum acidiphilum]GAD51979.1 hypothetical protein MBEHAL_0739 [Halarchaeum acidiphilum MH1-52-1]